MFYTNTRSPVKGHYPDMAEREKFSRLMRIAVMVVVVLILLALIWVFIEI